MFKKITFTCLLSLILISCSKDDAKPSAKVSKETLVTAGWLQNNLPENALGYIRIPNPWFFFSGQANGFEYAQSNKGHNLQVAAVRNGLFRTFIDSAQIPNKAALELFLKHQTSPLEIAVLQERPGQVMPVLMIASKFDFESTDAFAKQFQQVLQGLPMIQELAPINQQGEGELSIQGGSAHYQFNQANGQFRLMFGMFDMTTLKAVADQLKPGQPKAMQELQNQVDTSGQGLFAWVNGKDVMPMAEMMMPPYEMAQLQELGLGEVNAVALGYGTANSKARMRFAVDMPHVGVRQFLPKVENKLQLKTVGEPSAFALLSLPTYEQLEQIIRRIEPNEAEKALEDINKETQEALGIDFKQLASVLGPEMTIFKDTVGSFFAVRLNDKAGLNLLIEKLKQSGHGDYKTRSFKGTDIHHLTFQVAGATGLSALSSPSAGEVLGMLSQLSSHMFWIEEDGHLLLASIPQPLMERIEKGADIDLATWVAINQGQNIENALFAASGTFDGLSRSAYHTYVELLLFASELVNADIDVMAIPSAEKLAFAEQGTMGMQVDSTENQFAVEITFEQGPLDIFHAAGTMQAVAVTGILAAVAIPAYQDYVKRAELQAYRQYETQQNAIEALEELEDIDVIEIESEVIESVEDEIEETIIDNQ
ncbi:hypothetical protein [Kangiella sp. HZ709]|uniref:hypothetical protein n=1 Tax=Kangiella sp. HZ709 TaxID=2666328 RepID=UPI0012AF862D|nr:hypothetical protein [Kangiella sp. HZ709]MRX27269.1 hypothetical protein [Kangiella sp. HZ709]